MTERPRGSRDHPVLAHARELVSPAHDPRTGPVLDGIGLVVAPGSAWESSDGPVRAFRVVAVAPGPLAALLEEAPGLRDEVVELLARAVRLTLGGVLEDVAFELGTPGLAPLGPYRRA